MVGVVGRVRARATYTAARATAIAICEPQVRLGRRRHDGNCDRCDEPLGPYSCEKLDFPMDSLEPEDSTGREKLRAMLDAEYCRYCLECSADLEREEEE